MREGGGGGRGRGMGLREGWVGGREKDNLGERMGCGYGRYSVL